MIAWTTLRPIHVHEWLSRDTARQVNNVNSEINELLEARAQVEQHQAALASADVATVPADELLQGDGPKHTRFTLLQHELQVRSDITEALRLIDADRQQAHQQVFADLSAKREAIRAKLVEMGWLDLDKNIPHASKIQPAFIESHPEVVALREKVKELRGVYKDRRSDPRITNRDAITTITTELQAIRNRALVA